MDNTNSSQLTTLNNILGKPILLVQMLEKGSKGNELKATLLSNLPASEAVKYENAGVEHLNCG